MKKIDLETVADGVAGELFTREIAKVTENIADQNTKANSKRKITLNFEFIPDEDRDEVKVVVSSKVTLTPVKSYVKTSYLGKVNGKHTLLANDEKQTDLFEDGVTDIEKSKKAAR